MPLRAFAPACTDHQGGNWGRELGARLGCTAPALPTQDLGCVAAPSLSWYWPWQTEVPREPDLLASLEALTMFLYPFLQILAASSLNTCTHPHTQFLVWANTAYLKAGQALWATRWWHLSYLTPIPIDDIYQETTLWSKSRSSNRALITRCKPKPFLKLQIISMA